MREPSLQAWRHRRAVVRERARRDRDAAEELHFLWLIGSVQRGLDDLDAWRATVPPSTH